MCDIVQFSLNRFVRWSFFHLHGPDNILPCASYRLSCHSKRGLFHFQRNPPVQSDYCSAEIRLTIKYPISAAAVPFGFCGFEHSYLCRMREKPAEIPHCNPRFPLNALREVCHRFCLYTDSPQTGMPMHLNCGYALSVPF